MTLPAALISRLLLTGVLALASGCGENRGSGAADSLNLEAEPRAVVPDPVAGASVRLIVPDTVARGATVPMMIRISNTTSAPLDLYLRGRDVTFDISVSDSSGTEFWSRLEGETIPAILQIKTLGPGEELERRHEWDQRNKRGRPAAAGVYTLRASVLTDGSSSLIANEASLVIRP